MEEIKKLDDKYVVIKTEDLEKYFSQFTKGIFTTEDEGKVIDRIPFNTVLEEIKKDRESFGKQQQKYVVLNLDDEANIDYLISKLVSHTKRLTTPYVQIKDISVDLINAILIAGNP